MGKRTVLDLYRKEISEFSLLDRSQEVDLAERLADARRRLANAVRHLPVACKETTLIIDPAPWRRPDHRWTFEAVAHFERQFALWIGQKQRMTRLERRISRHLLSLNRARDAMITSNLRLVVQEAKKYTGFGVSYQDLIQEGNLVLFNAVWRFDGSKGYKFSTYAFWWLKQALIKACYSQSGQIRVPQGYAEKHLKPIREARKALRQLLGRQPTDEEVADFLSETADSKTVASIESRFIARFIPIDHPLGEDDDGNGYSLGDTLTEKYELDLSPEDLRELAFVIRRYLMILDRREEEIIRRRFGIDGVKQMTLKEIGDEIGLSRERVRQIEALAIGKIHALARRRKDLRCFLTS